MRTQSQSLLEIISFFRLSEQESSIQPAKNQNRPTPIKNNGSASSASMPESAPTAARRNFDSGSSAAIDESQFERF